MGVLSDEQIIVEEIVSPCSGRAEKGIISYGVSSYGYDARIGREVLEVIGIHVGLEDRLIDPKNFNEDLLSNLPTHRGEDGREFVILNPHSFVLGVSKEKFKIPDDVVAVCMGKSTYARCGLVVNVTPLEPGWTGHVTIEISNTTSLPVKMYLEEGIMQVVFHRSDFKPLYTKMMSMLHLVFGRAKMVSVIQRVLKWPRCLQTYADKSGKYQNQPDAPVTAKVLPDDEETE